MAVESLNRLLHAGTRGEREIRNRVLKSLHTLHTLGNRRVVGLHYHQRLWAGEMAGRG